MNYLGKNTLRISEKVCKRARQLRDHGMDPERRYWHSEVGFNYRMTNIQAAIGVAQLERVKYFIDKKLYPNVDFYSGLTLRALGFPKEMFTVLFAVARTVGWISQWNEMIEDPEQKIGRPRQLYTGDVDNEYVDIKNR